jgi:hypothetical protein
MQNVESQGRQSIVSSGGMYTILDYIEQMKRGVPFSRAESSLLLSLKKDIQFWEHLSHMKALGGHRR